MWERTQCRIPRQDPGQPQTILASISRRQNPHPAPPPRWLTLTFANTEPSDSGATRTADSFGFLRCGQNEKNKHFFPSNEISTGRYTACHPSSYIEKSVILPLSLQLTRSSVPGYFGFWKYFLRPEELLLYICRRCCLRRSAEKGHSGAGIKESKCADQEKTLLFWGWGPPQGGKKALRCPLTQSQSCCQIKQSKTSTRSRSRWFRVASLLKNGGSDPLLWGIRLLRQAEVCRLPWRRSAWIWASIFARYDDRESSIQFCFNSVACLHCLSVIWFQAGSLQPVDLGLSSENSCPLWLEITQNPRADFEGLSCGLQKLKQKAGRREKKSQKACVEFRRTVNSVYSPL